MRLNTQAGIFLTMAVIEEESGGESDSRSRLGMAAAEQSGYCSDGYETASDTELNDSTSNKDNGFGNHNDASSGRIDGDEVSREVNERVCQEKVESIEAEANEVKTSFSFLFPSNVVLRVCFDS
ncbi:Unknown protein [Striga hermonthica]|uniref:Uncharacterized protein n=1 Tax=Striga hermonthica TaxID=68872 RepID=A0A9N7R9X1_STRHE|nr:Unknown protein [Striga hermonthica]